MKCNAITICGLGLIGGSLLKALQGFEGATFYGIDTNDATWQAARNAGLIEDERDAAAAFAKADVSIICLPPEATLDCINQNTFKESALVTDVCGVKQAIYEGLTNQNIDFIGGHPMAGREVSGFSASNATLFRNASYLITPTETNSPEHVDLLKRMAAYIGCRETVITTPAEHDAMIAYTSQLMHVVAAVLCASPRLLKAKDFSAGSLRDCTRVAKLDSRLWSQLFLANREELSACITEFENGLDVIKACLSRDDAAGLADFLEQSVQRKAEFLA